MLLTQRNMIAVTLVKLT